MAQPIDLQNVLSKTQAAEKVAKLEKARPEITQKQFAVEFQDKVDAKQKKVQYLDQSDEVIIHKDQEKEQNGNNGKKKKSDSGHKTKETKEAQSADENEDHIDLLA